MTTPAVPQYWPLLTRLRECLCLNLAATVGGSPARCCVVAGNAVALDDCCDGTAWVRFEQIEGSDLDAFPGPSNLQSTGSCGQTIAAITVGIGVMRCASTMDEDGNAPDCAALEHEALIMASDIDALFKTAHCCADEAQGVILSSIGQYSPQGPQGGCVGGELQIVFGIELCPCEP